MPESLLSFCKEKLSQQIKNTLQRHCRPNIFVSPSKDFKESASISEIENNQLKIEYKSSFEYHDASHKLKKVELITTTIIIPKSSSDINSKVLMKIDRTLVKP